MVLSRPVIWLIESFTDFIPMNSRFTDITEHPTREGKIYCCAVLDAFSRRIVGWSIDTVQNANLVVNALDMAIKNRNPAQGGIVHADHGAQFTSWAFTNKIRQAGLMPSFGSVGDGLDNAIDENRSGQACKSSYSTASEKKTRIELANAIFEYIEIFHNRQRRHSGLAYRTPIEFELAYENPSIPA
jgi:putative transposase